MEQRNVYSDVSGPTGRRRNSTIEAYKQVLLLLYLGGWGMAFLIHSYLARFMLMFGLAAILLVAIYMWLVRKSGSGP